MAHGGVRLRPRPPARTTKQHKEYLDVIPFTSGEYSFTSIFKIMSYSRAVDTVSHIDIHM